MAGSGVSGWRGGSLYGGFDHKFVEAVDDFTCSICTKVLREPHLTVCCGQHYCSSCLEHWAKTQAKPTRCLYCRQTTDFRHFLDKKMERKIKSLHVLCVHSEDGCQWKGELRNLGNHLNLEKGCSFVQVDCSNNCGVLVRRKDMQQHMKKECQLRTYRCVHCGNEGKYKDITTQHYAKCSKYPLPCPKGCPAVVKRADLKAHKNECPLEEVACPYSEAGCDDTLLRKDVDGHLKQNCNQHLMMIAHPFLQLKDKFEALHVSASEMATKLVALERDMYQRWANTIAKVDKTSAKVDETNTKVQKNASEMSSEIASSERAMYQKLASTNARMNGKVDATSARVDETNARVKRIAVKVEETNTRLNKTNVWVDEARARVNDLRRCMNETSSKLEAFETDMRRMQWKLATRLEETDTRVVETSDETNTRVDETNERVEELERSVSELSTKLVSSERDMKRMQLELANTNLKVNQTNIRVDETNVKVQKSMSEMSSELASSDRIMYQRLANINARLTERLDETNARVNERANATNKQLEEVQSSIVCHNCCLLVLCIIVIALFIGLIGLRNALDTFNKKTEL